MVHAIAAMPWPTLGLAFCNKEVRHPKLVSSETAKGGRGGEI